MTRNERNAVASGAIGVVVGLACGYLFMASISCVSIPKDQGITKQTHDSPGSTVDRIKGDENTVAGIATRSDSTIAETDQSTTEQTGKVNTSVSERVSAGGNVNTDDWTSRILAFGALWPFGFFVYNVLKRFKWFRVAVDNVAGKPDYMRVRRIPGSIQTKNANHGD